MRRGEAVTVSTVRHLRSTLGRCHRADTHEWLSHFRFPRGLHPVPAAVMTNWFEDDSSRQVPAERCAVDALFTAAYQELRRLARALKRSDPNATITPTMLVNEAWMKLARSPGFELSSHLHFKRIVARAMRQVLIEAARRRRAD